LTIQVENIPFKRKIYHSSGKYIIQVEHLVLNWNINHSSGKIYHLIGKKHHSSGKYTIQVCQIYH